MPGQNLEVILRPSASVPGKEFGTAASSWGKTSAFSFAFPCMIM